ncbi:MAG: biopolymer transporter ExbD [bacterium]|nr:biopolymer transporter ExbD [bacterium]
MKSPQLLSTGTTSINMTPMIDVVFLLIIFFLVSSHLAKQENAVRLDLPKAVSGLDEESESSLLVVNILPDGAWQVGGRQVDEPLLEAAMAAKSKQAGNQMRLKIRTDRSVVYSRIEPVLKAATAVGCGDIVFSVFEDRGR